MKVTIIPIVICAFGTVTKVFLEGLEDLEVSGRVETIQTTALLRTARILRRVLETWVDLLSLKLQWTTISVSWSEKTMIINKNRRKWKREQYLKHVKIIKKCVEHEGFTVIPIVNGTLGTIHKGLEKGLKEFENSGRIETIKTTVLLR